MANPAWKKTAEKMTPTGNFDPNKPSSSLTLDWVHGSRGFDCRNNVTYADKNCTNILFTAAALVIVQTNDKNEKNNMLKNVKSSKKQDYYGEHTDDIIAITMVEFWNENSESENGKKEENGILIASGEIGKTPAINIYNWNNNNNNNNSNNNSDNNKSNDNNNNNGGTYEMLVCAKGFHTTGISQLSFSKNGNRLFSVGLDYTVAVYDTKRDSRTTFGKMVGVYNHICSCNGSFNSKCNYYC